MSDTITPVPMPECELDPEFQFALLHKRLNVVFDKLQGTPPSATERQFISVDEVPQIVPVPVKTVRWWLFYNSLSFRDRVAVKRGRRVYIDREALLVWISEGNATLALKRQKGKGKE